MSHAHCPLCDGLLSPKEVESLFSSLESKKGEDASGSQSVCPDREKVNIRLSSLSLDPIDETKFESLCYGCKRLVNDGKTADIMRLFPPVVSRPSQSMTRDENLRRQISDFLLDDEEDNNDSNNSNDL